MLDKENIPLNINANIPINAITGESLENEIDDEDVELINGLLKTKIIRKYPLSRIQS